MRSYLLGRELRRVDPPDAEVKSERGDCCLHRSTYVTAAVALLTLLALVRVVQTYPVTAQGFDEPCHVSSGLELLDKGTYNLDPYNTPLARIAIGLPLRLAGVRYPRLLPDNPNSRNYNYVGNQILNESGHYMRNLELARAGILPFLVLSVVVVFLWTRREFGDLAALMSVALFTTLPVILAFSSIAYTDMAAAFAQSAGLFAFATLLDKPSKKAYVWVGFTAGIALLAKFTTLVFLPAGAAFMVICRWLMRSRDLKTQRITTTHSLLQVAVASLVAIAVIWAGYGFSIGHVQESMQLSPQSMPSFQHFPRPLRPIAREIVLSNPPVPAPGLLHGIAAAYAFNKEGQPSYFLGRIKKGGWWYFFAVDLALKTPLSFLFLSIVGFVALAGLAHKKQWTSLSPGLSVVAILLATTTVNVYYGIRHVIVLFPLLAIVAGYGASYLWRLEGSRRFWGRALLATLLIGQLFSTIAARHDYIAYFNALAGSDPSKMFVAGCDLDCGQDIIRLSNVLRAKRVSNVTLALWTSADMTRANLPSFTVPEPFHPVTGWFAISLRALRMGELFHSSYPPNAFSWLDRYRPIERVGKTILLYDIPRSPDSTLNHEPAKDRPSAQYLSPLSRNAANQMSPDGAATH
jgi:4-amino-4-deoxy-L-arabinose transferase-like glycosyltransferase